MKKCTGDDGDIDDIAKNVNIAMQKIGYKKIYVGYYPTQRT
jgi:hypothetical protein